MLNSVHKSIKSPPEETGCRKSETIEQYPNVIGVMTYGISAIDWRGSRTNGQNYFY